MTSYYKSSSVCLSVCLFVCSPTPPRSFDRSSPNLVGVCRWTSELPLRVQRVNGSNVTFSEQTTPGWDHTAAKGVPSKRRTACKSLIPSTGIITSKFNVSLLYFWLRRKDYVPQVWPEQASNLWLLDHNKALLETLLTTRPSVAYARWSLFLHFREAQLCYYS